MTARPKSSLRAKRSNLVVALAAGTLLLAGTARANNLALSNGVLTGKTGSTYNVRFDVSWDNSWYTSGAPSASANWDAAWVVVKFSTRQAGGGWTEWKHATLSGSGHVAPAGSQIKLGLTGGTTVGAFLYRNAPGAGSNNWTAAELRWNFQADGVLSTDTVRVKVFGLEMVYVSSGSFYLGSGGGGTSEFYLYPTPGNTYPVASEAAITVGQTAGNLYYANSSSGGDQTGPIPAAFPKGFAAFYLMKGELSQRQYCDFLNTLTAPQSGARIDTGGHINEYRNWITKASNGLYGTDANGNAGAWGSADYTKMNEASDGGWTAANFVSWADLAAYADWAALRPMTELEFEKAARGPQFPVADEYAWGNSSITPATGVSGDGTKSEKPSNADANCNYGWNVTGPLRSGSMAQTGTTRAQAGAGYYGALDLSGNLWERTVSAGIDTGRAFTGLHGDGKLNSTGDANVANWPGADAYGSGFRGGDWGDGSPYARVSDRYYAAYTYSYRYSDHGGRLARTSP